LYKCWYLIAVFVLMVSLPAGCASPAPTAAPTKPPVAPAATTAALVVTAGATGPAAAIPVATKPAAAAATVSPTLPPAPAVKRGGTLVSSRTSSVNDYDPQLNGAAAGPSITAAYDPLLTMDVVDFKTGKYDFIPALAESWKIVEPKIIEFKLRKGVKFQDGSDWNAEVAKWNLERVMNHKKSVGKHLVSEIAGVDLVDPSIIRINLKSPLATLFVNLTASAGGTGSNATYMVSKATVDKGGDETLSANPVGTGPFVIEQWLRDDRVTMKRWDGYWQKGADGKSLPYLDRFVERVIMDPSIALVEMKAGTLQLTEQLEAKDYATVKSNPDLVLWEMPWSSTTQFIFGFNQKAAPFQGNLKLAQAAQYALDREGLAKVMTFGQGEPAYYLFWTSALLGYNGNLPNYKFDMAKSKQLLTEAGYPSGVDINMLVQSRQPNSRIAEVVKQMWDTAGIRTTLDVVERLASQAKAKAGNFQVYFWRQSSSPDPDLQSRVVACDAPSNWSSYCNPDLDKCMAEGRGVYENAPRQQIYERCIRLIQDNPYIGAGYFEHDNKVFHKSVKGLKVHWTDTDVREIWLDK
jgi:peptide/nickel transport system substrate-binding protein